MKLAESINLYFPDMNHRDTASFLEKLDALPGELGPIDKNTDEVKVYIENEQGENKNTYSIRRENYLPLKIIGLVDDSERKCEVGFSFSHSHQGGLGLKNSDGDVFNFYSSPKNS